jgi:peptidoglycan/LPS O-acetylase OafA/YrhL
MALDQAEAERPAVERSDFRADIQGLRAVAVLLVALCHANVPGLAGGFVGVDVFFVISGFLITGWLLRDSARSGKLSFGRFYSARARRILPAAALTLITTCLFSYLFINYVRALSVTHDALWAAFFLANFHFAAVGTNYFAQSQGVTSPLQHFWSLAVEEQFYLIWPAILAIVLFVVRAGSLQRFRGGKDRRPSLRTVDAPAMRRLLLVLAAGLIASFAWSVYDTSSNPTAAYFSTAARAWELGIGALVAVSSARLSRLPAAARAIGSWFGLVGIALSATWFSASTAFPGYAALLPVLSAALVLVGGLGQGSKRGAGLLLGRQPMRYIGDVSYSFYLWHWPFLIIAEAHEGHTLSTWTNLAILVVAFGVSSLTYTFFENPLRHARFFVRRQWGLVLWPVSVASVVLTASLTMGAIESAASPSHGGPTTTLPLPKGIPGGKPLSPWEEAVLASVQPSRLATPVPANLTPPILNLQNDFFYLTNCDYENFCHFGDTTVKRTIVVFGDSHAEMWMPDFVSFAKAEKWDLVALVKPGCVAQDWVTNKESCTSWDTWALGEIRRLHPAAIILSSEYAHWIGQSKRAWTQSVNGAGDEINALKGLAPKFLVMEDPPFMPKQPVDCLLASGATLGSCTFPLPSWYARMMGEVSHYVSAAHASFVPTSQWFCQAGKCPFVVENTITRIDDGHVSRTYAEELLTPLSAELAAALKTTAH